MTGRRLALMAAAVLLALPGSACVLLTTPAYDRAGDAQEVARQAARAERIAQRAAARATTPVERDAPAPAALPPLLPPAPDAPAAAFDSPTLPPTRVQPFAALRIGPPTAFAPTDESRAAWLARGESAEQAEVAAALAADPTDLIAAEWLATARLAAVLPPDADWDAALEAFDAVTAALDIVATAAPDSAESGQSRWTALRRATRDADVRALFDMAHRETWVSEQPTGLDPPVARSLTTYRTALLTRVRRENMLQLQDILTRIGWFDISSYGQLASEAAWLIVQRADFDPDWQRAMIDALDRRVRRGDFQAPLLARLRDRVAVSDGLPQLYGNEGRCTAPGDWQPWPIAEPESVDDRRAAVGLDPLLIEQERQRAACP